MNIKLRTQDVNLSFGSHHVLKDINLEIPEKHIVALIGASGSGKSTLLRCMNRMHDLNANARVSGKIFLDDTNIYDQHVDVVRIRREIGMVFQHPNPFPKSIFNNIAYGLRINNTHNKEELRKKVEQSLKESYLWDEVSGDMDKSAMALSGGQQQRLCIARTIAVRPEIILMDEPCSALDPISTRKIEELMLNLKSQYTIVIVTHNMQQAQRVSDYVAFMHLGELVEFGEKDKIFEDPQEELTANYINGQFG